MRRIKIISEIIRDEQKIFELENGDVIAFVNDISPDGYEMEWIGTDDGQEETGFVLKQ